MRPHPSQVGLEPSVDRGSREGHDKHDEVDDVEGAHPRAHLAQRRQVHLGLFPRVRGKIKAQTLGRQVNNSSVLELDFYYVSNNPISIVS